MAGLFDLNITRAPAESPTTFANYDPWQMAKYGAAHTGQAVGDAANTALRGALGRPNDQERLDAAKAEIQARLQGKDMKDPMVAYPVIIEVLQKYGFVEQAMQYAKEFETLSDKRKTQTRLEAKDSANAQFLKAKAEAMVRGDFKAKMDAYGEILTKLQDPALSDSDRTTLMNMKRAAEAQLGIKDRNGLKIVPPSKYSKGGVFRQDSAGDWKFEDVDMARDVPAGGGSGGGQGKPPSGYRWKEDGSALEPIPGGPKDPENQKTTMDEDKRDASAGLIGELQNEFDESFSGGGFKFMPDWVARSVQDLQRRGIVAGSQEELLWWQKYDDWYNRMLNQLSGAAVTESEAARFKATVVTRGMDPKLARERLKEQVRLAKLGMSKQARKQQVSPKSSEKKTVKFGDLK